MDSPETPRRIGLLRALWCRLDAWAAGRLTPEELAEAREADERFKRHAWRVAAGFLALSGVLGVLLWLIKPSFGLGQSLALAGMLCFGLGLCLVSAFYGYRKFVGPQGWRKMATVGVMSFLGVITGIVVASWGMGRPIAMDAAAVLRFLALALLVATILAVIIMGVALMRAREGRQREARLKAEADSERLSRQGAQAELKLLQAQVEPHFLFNTLANLRFLVQTGSPDALAMLDHLIHYLRTALPEIRAEGSTVGREVELARAYLEILRIRMGGALEIETSVEPALEREPIPPLMVITLVENAIQHGIAPKGRGRVTVRASAIERGVRITVEDDGRGIVDPVGRGVGLVNIRERLKGLFGDRARLELTGREGGGTVAAIEISAGPGA